ncbi:prepilin peptidase dependent protein B [Alteromonas sp. KUL49]|nr:prepilin peptidase dependent protein B [Alteromonas sp. KUL49]
MLSIPRGLSLTESVIALFIGVSVVIASTSASLHLHHKITTLTHSMQIQEEWLTLTQFITSQLQRAGYRAMNISDVIAVTHSPALPVVISKHPLSAQNSCVLFSNDKDRDGQWSTKSPSEHLGFRLYNQALEYRVSNKACHAAGWFDMTDPNTTSVSKFDIKVAHQERDFVLLGITLHLNHKDCDAKAHHQFFVKVQHAW